MVCKEDVVSWFKELESYKRIDAMCTLLNMCLPFELRFIGTYLEELGKRDFQELRGAELRANNPTDLAADVGGANADPRTRRKMALYVSLLRSCNFACATTLYNAMVSLEQSGLLKGLCGDLLEEILLLYTMALHHPAFTFDQKSHFGDILEKLKIEDQRIQYQEGQEDHVNIPSPSSCISQSSIAPNMSVPPPSMTTLGPPPGLMFVKPPAVQGPVTSTDPVGRLDELSSPPVITGGPGVVPICEVPHHPPGIPLPQYNMTDYVVGQHTWPTNIIVSPINQPLEVLNYPPPTVVGSSSPLVSSPGDSRAGSPRPRRHSRERSPPPAPPDHPPLATLAANFENLTVNDIRRMEDERLRELGMPPSAVQQLRSIEKLNGVRRRGAARSSSDSSSSAASSPPGTPAPVQRRPVPQPVLPYVPFPRYPAYPAPPGAYRPPPPPFANGEPTPFPGGPPYAGMYPGPVMFAAPKLSCWNCGGAGHAGHDCKEPSMEEMTRAGGYQLDFGGAPPDPADK